MGLEVYRLNKQLPSLIYSNFDPADYYNPADLLAMLTPNSLDKMFWIVVIFAYYMLATLLPIDKLIGKLYPLFGIALLFMALGIMTMLYVHAPQMPEMWEGFYNHKADPEANPIFPMMFVSIACGAISGFHATQSPMMARCLKNEKLARPVFTAPWWPRVSWR